MQVIEEGLRSSKEGECGRRLRLIVDLKSRRTVVEVWDDLHGLVGWLC